MPSRSVRPRIPETTDSQRKARLAWNQGLTGNARQAETTTVVETCTVDACGTPTHGPHRGTGMVQIHGSQDGAPAHWYCPDRCAAIARARAELRAIPMRPGGES